MYAVSSRTVLIRDKNFPPIHFVFGKLENAHGVHQPLFSGFFSGLVSSCLLYADVRLHIPMTHREDRQRFTLALTFFHYLPGLCARTFYPEGRTGI